MHNLVTLVLILHNRYKNLYRLIEYYKHSSLKIIIADSSKEKQNFSDLYPYCHHLYVPNTTFTQKIELVLEEVNTPYVVMCADDDFIIPDAILECVDFLEKNSDYTIAQGNCIKYYKNSISGKNVAFDILYPPKNYSIEINDLWLRLEKMFEVYRSVLYAVHRTETLQLAFKDASSYVSNLYLNEYLTAVIPILAGKYKELPMLYQVREYAADSDDKITDNLDTIFKSNLYQKEKKAFLELLVQNASLILEFDKELIYSKIYQILESFSNTTQVAKEAKNMSLKKRLGVAVTYIPIIGKWMIETNRRFERNMNLSQVIKTDKEKDQLHEIEELLKRHAV